MNRTIQNATHKQLPLGSKHNALHKELIVHAHHEGKEGIRDFERLELLNPLDPFGVMICSTVRDLIEAREAADSAIHGLHLTRLRAETFGSLSYSPLDVCALLAKQCDLLVLLIGERYGHIIESKGISVVEFEYQVAREQNPEKILAYVKEVPKRERRLEEFLRRVQHFEHGYFTSAFATPEDLYGAIQRDVVRWLASQAKHKNLRAHRV